MIRSSLLTLALTLAAACQQAGPSGKPHEQAAAPVAPKEPLAVGTPSPDFTAVAHDGTTIQMSKLQGHPVVLYFYPKDETPG